MRWNQRIKELVGEIETAQILWLPSWLPQSENGEQFRKEHRRLMARIRHLRSITAGQFESHKEEVSHLLRIHDWHMARIRRMYDELREEVSVAEKNNGME